MPKQDQRQILQACASQYLDGRGHSSLWTQFVSGHGWVVGVGWELLCSPRFEVNMVERLKKSFGHPLVRVPTHIQISTVPIPAADSHALSDGNWEVKEQSSPRQWGFHTDWAKECHCMNTVNHPTGKTLVAVHKWWLIVLYCSNKTFSCACQCKTIF